MASRFSSITLLASSVLLLAIFAAPTAAFGAGNIASIARIEGQNWRHGDIEDTLLNILMSRAAGGKKFGKLDVKRVYFGNWLRDYSQAVDVGTVKYVSAEAIRIILWVLGFMSFGYGTKEFEVTMDRLGCYRPEEHIDNPKDYADNIDARQYDRRLRGPVDERRELSVNPQTGLKNYIATEGMGITTSAELVRNLFGKSIDLGRRYARSGNKAELHEALRLLGTGCHCLEDFSAHSNYTELALLELGERDVFPHVGRRTTMDIQGARYPIFPIITGTFGGVDFLHSVMGEFSDKATQSEIQELEGTMANNQQNNSSILQDLLNQVPSGLFGDKDQAGKANELQTNATAAQMQQTHISPRQPEAWTRQLHETQRQIYPILEWHDEMMQSITEAIEKIPVLPQLLENLQEQLNIFVFSLLAPFVLPIVNQVKTELNTGSSEIIQSSKDKQLIVFRDDNSSDPTHSMLSKDHFSNVLNEPAGKIASQVLKWVVPQLIACWDDERIDIGRTLNRVIYGTFHHPALRDYGDDGAVDGRRGMFSVVEQWWRDQSEQERQVLRDQLSRDGVEQGRNHKPGVIDSGHGCGKPLGMPNLKTAQSSGAVGGLAGAGVLGEISDALTGQSKYDGGFTGGGGGSSSGGVGKFVGEAAGGGAIGGIVGGIAGAVGGDLLGEAFGGSETKKKTHQSSQYESDGSYTQNVTQTGYTAPQSGHQRYGSAEYSQTNFVEGGGRESYQRYEQDDYGRGSGFGQSVVQETRPTYGGGYEQTTEQRYERPGVSGNRKFESKDVKLARDDSDSDADDLYKLKKKHHKNHDSDDSDYERQRQRFTQQEFEGESGGHGGGGGYGGGYESRQQEGYGGAYESRQEQSYGGGGYESRQQEGYGSGGNETSSGYGGEGYGGGREDEDEGRGGGGGGFFGGDGGSRDDEDEGRGGGGSGFFGGGNESRDDENEGYGQQSYDNRY
ncbi:uncharacterized protein KY384_001583 [Bacidia gigantensis]|uniref:uncharacterized protein n=1 Tax=Bacidia gigantensis TaxID=2732470 RepID=UPI001D05B3F0|nr:uncharacterized protein KY384_001583 [Bacidia gigantensis]KAG8533842.1 hypothetical protein KY384_001583 [Bacidia gigantensis]